mmetsp:Transcript_120521/g.239898  ORF Transcript_120521/g.239898 Transcript_120521/m.239898 type:complete len:247 (-) Transcript_120521:13-753(-)
MSAALNCRDGKVLLSRSVFASLRNHAGRESTASALVLPMELRVAGLSPSSSSSQPPLRACLSGPKPKLESSSTSSTVALLPPLLFSLPRLALLPPPPLASMSSELIISDGVLPRVSGGCASCRRVVGDSPGVSGLPPRCKRLRLRSDAKSHSGSLAMRLSETLSSSSCCSSLSPESRKVSALPLTSSDSSCRKPKRPSGHSVRPRLLKSRLLAPARRARRMARDTSPLLSMARLQGVVTLWVRDAA